jgi:SAM-dependent methyltransferase
MSMIFQMNSPEGKAILAKARRGDFAHPGEEEAIELVAAGVERSGVRRVLDVGCGRGGTAAWFHQHGWGKVVGVDVDKKSIDHARAAYPGVEFVALDVGRLADWRTEPFDFACLFNSFYAFPDQLLALRNIRSVCRPGASLCIFDYARSQESVVPAELGLEIGHPIVLEDMPDLFVEAGWVLVDSEDCTESYIGWYRNLLAGFQRERAWIDANFGEDWRQYVLSWYGALGDALAARTLRGVVFRATAA